MQDKGFSLEDYLKLTHSLALMKNQAINFNPKHNDKYKELVSELENAPNNTLKGKKFEKLVDFIVSNIPIFKTYKNIRTATNEIDILIELDDIGKKMLRDGMLGLKSDVLLIECKNYSGKIDVTWVGKFCNIISNSQSRVGILVSNEGFKGRHNWDSAKGLVRKFYYSKERLDEKKFVLDITLDELKKVTIEYNLIELIESKIKAIENDTKFEHFLTKHPAE